MIERLYIAVHRVLLGTHIGDYCLAGDVFWIKHTAQIQAVYDIGKGDVIELCNNFGIGNLLCIQCEHDVFLINTCQRYE